MFNFSGGVSWFKTCLVWTGIFMIIGSYLIFNDMPIQTSWKALTFLISVCVGGALSIITGMSCSTDTATTISENTRNRLFLISIFFLVGWGMHMYMNPDVKNVMIFCILALPSFIGSGISARWNILNAITSVSSSCGKNNNCACSIN